MNLRLNMEGKNPPLPEAAEIEVGSICQTHQGRYYLIVAMPGPSREWRTSEYCYYFSIDPRTGEFIRPGQILLGYAESNWKVVGKATLTVSDPEWY